MYPAELEIKDTTENTTSSSYLDLLLSIERDGQLHTSIYDKRDDFNFHITNFPFWVVIFHPRQPMAFFISQLIRYARACSSYKWDFPVSYSNRDTSWDAWDRDSGSFMTLIPTLTFTELRVVSMKHLQRMWHASRERLPFRTPGSVPHFGTC